MGTKIRAEHFGLWQSWMASLRRCISSSAGRTVVGSRLCQGKGLVLEKLKEGRVAREDRGEIGENREREEVEGPRAGSGEEGK